MSHLADFADGTERVDVINSPIVKATNTNASNTGTSVAIQIGASTDWTVVVTSSDELVFRHNGNAKMLLTVRRATSKSSTTSRHLLICPDYNGA